MSSIANYCKRVAELVARKKPGTTPVSPSHAKFYMLLGYSEHEAANTIVSKRSAGARR